MRKNKRLKDALSILRGQVSPAQYTQIYAGIAVIQEKASSEQLTAIKKSIYTEQIGFVIDSVLESIVKPQVSDFLPRIYSSIDWRVLSSFVDSVFKLKLPDTASNQLGFVYESYLYQFLYNSGSEYFTPSCILNLIFDILPPHDGGLLPHDGDGVLHEPLPLLPAGGHRDRPCRGHGFHGLCLESR